MGSKVSEAKRLEIIACAREHPEWGGDRIARECGVSKESARKYREAPPQKEPNVPSETNEFTDDRWTISLPKTRIHTLEELIEHCKIDLTIWEIERWACNKWEVGRKDKSVDLSWTKGAADGSVHDTGKIFVEPLFQVKAFLRKRKWAEEAERIIERLRKKAEGYAPKYPVIKKTPTKSGNIVEVSPVDIHHGALIWGKETGGPDWDLKISEKVHKDATSALISRTDDYKPEAALVILGHDQQNSDNREGSTEAGTAQNNDGRYQKVSDVSLDCSIWTIDACLQHYGRVLVKMVPGNHDALSTWHLGRVLKAWYRHCPQVEIDNSPNMRKYWEYGVNMLLFTHGNKGKLENYPGTMAAEQPAMWGRTRWHEAHTGDKHQRRLIELHGATVRILPSLRPSCIWGAENHYVGSVRAAEAYVWNKDEGLIGTACYSILDK